MLCDFNKLYVLLQMYLLFSNFVQQMVAYISESVITTKMLRTSFTRIALRHPMLRMHLNRASNGDFHFETLNTVIVNIEERTKTDWVSVWEESAAVKLGNDDQPLWFVRHLPEAKTDYTTDHLRHQCNLIISFHHAITDALSVLEICNEVMIEIHSEMKGEAIVAIGDSTLSQSIPPSLEKVATNHMAISDKMVSKILIFFSKNQTNFFMKMAKLGQRSLFMRHSSVQALFQREQKAITCKPTSSVVPVSFSKEQTNALFTECKKHKVSPLAALAAAYFVCLDKHASIRDRNVTFTLSSNLRKFVENEYEDINAYRALYVSLPVMQVKMPSVDKSMWTIAKEYQRVVHSDIERKTMRAVWSVELFNMLSKSDTSSILDRSCFLAGFHNAGRVDFLNRSDESPIRLAACYGSVSDYDVAGCLFNIFSMTHEGKFSFTFAYSTNVVTKQFAEKLGGEIKETLIKSEEIGEI